ncbi:DnaJ domain-containing protein [Poriferisphaera sp. WC338]|uniref:DnaJ domain-containing protein n=1 Tax=Poriferisphaera sp. WC338 TaxID=3425129 RepID=UPI003D815372
MTMSSDNVDIACRRNAPRHAAAGIQCQLGQILDLSATGMRVECKGAKSPVKPGQTGNIQLEHQNKKIKLNAQARWVKRKGLFKHEVGLKFIDQSSQSKQILSDIAQFGFICDNQFLTPEDASSQQVKEPVRASLELPDYYRTLDISPSASSDEIRKAYRQLAQVYHPDHNPNEADRFKEINEAYHLLADPEQREAYDQLYKK